MCGSLMDAGVTVWCEIHRIPYFSAVVINVEEALDLGTDINAAGLVQ